MDELVKLFDLSHCSKSGAKFDYKKRLQATQGYWPIPQDEIDISNGVLEQNPGWDASAQFSDWNNM
jgi:hypothetical protein